MGRKVSYASHGVALHLNIGAEHLSDQGFETTKLDYQELILGFEKRARQLIECYRGQDSAYYLRQDCRGRRWQLAGLPCHDCSRGKEWGREYPGQPA
jgi:hypothetical protein